MSEKKKEILEYIGREFPNLTEMDKTYLVGFMEGIAAMAGNQAARPGREG